MQSMYVRVKRHMTTWFVGCEPSERVADVKRRLRELTERPEGEQRLVLVASGDLLDDNRTLADQKVENDCVVGLILKNPDGSWEELTIERPEDHMSGLDAEAM